MIMVWLSIALAVVAVIWFVIRAVNESKRIKDKVIRCSKSVEILREKSENILKQNEALQKTTAEITKDIEHKRRDLAYLKEQGQEFVGTMKESKEHIVESYRHLSQKAQV